MYGYAKKEEEEEEEEGEGEGEGHTFLYAGRENISDIKWGVLSEYRAKTLCSPVTILVQFMVVSVCGFLAMSEEVDCWAIVMMVVWYD